MVMGLEPHPGRAKVLTAPACKIWENTDENTIIAKGTMNFAKHGAWVGHVFKSMDHGDDIKGTLRKVGGFELSAENLKAQDAADETRGTPPSLNPTDREPLLFGKP